MTVVMAAIRPPEFPEIVDHATNVLAQHDEAECCGDHEQQEIFHHLHQGIRGILNTILSEELGNTGKGGGCECDSHHSQGELDQAEGVGNRGYAVFHSASGVFGGEIGLRNQGIQLINCQSEHAGGEFPKHFLHFRAEWVADFWRKVTHLSGLRDLDGELDDTTEDYRSPEPHQFHVVKIPCSNDECANEDDIKECGSQCGHEEITIGIEDSLSPMPRVRRRRERET